MGGVWDGGRKGVHDGHGAGHNALNWRWKAASWQVNHSWRIPEDKEWRRQTGESSMVWDFIVSLLSFMTEYIPDLLSQIYIVQTC